jgi:Xaa-Pro aminopeptidase
MMQPGVSEYDIQLDLEFFIKRQGAEVAFAPTVVSGPNSAKPHGKAGERKLEVGDFVTLDLGAKKDGYCSDITRTFVIGEASERHKEVYGQVLAAQVAAIEALKVGTPANEPDSLSRSILAEKGLDQYFGHGLGHGLGRAVHDYGGLAPSSKDTIEAGQVWTVEPGVYIEGFGGVRIEDDVHVTAEGPQILTHFPKELMVL